MTSKFDESIVAEDGAVAPTEFNPEPAPESGQEPVQESPKERRLRLKAEAATRDRAEAEARRKAEPLFVGTIVEDASSATSVAENEQPEPVEETPKIIVTPAPKPKKARPVSALVKKEMERGQRAIAARRAQ